MDVIRGSATGAEPIASPSLDSFCDDQTIAFGPFRLVPARRALFEGDRPVRLGSRALDILVALVGRAGEVIGKDDLIAVAWPDTFVEDSNLRVHVAALRKALGDGRDGARYIVNDPGRGYSFVAPFEDLKGPVAPVARIAEPSDHLPALLNRIVGRAETIQGLVSQLRERRFVTIVGPGGIGKTTVALAVARVALDCYRDRVRFVDLGSVADPRLVPSALASVLGLATASQNSVPSLVAYLGDKGMLLVLDNCEHVIEAAAALCESIISGAANVHVLATSREPLRAAGEQVHRLSPLELPPAKASLSAADALSSPAVQLFVERAGANDDRFGLTDADAPIVAEICRRLDGIALAIELAADRIEVFGLRGLAERLDDRFRLLTQGRRTALPRHKTLGAMIDWSYELLSDRERTVFRRLGILAGGFTLASATAIVRDDAIGEAEAVDAVASLVAKSLVAADASPPCMSYRLLDTMRAYALRQLAESAEIDAMARRHAEHFREVFEHAARDWETMPTDEWLDGNRGGIGNLRAALDWAFSPNGDAGIAVNLTVAAVPLWFQLSLIDECRRGVERALAVPIARADKRLAMQLNAALGWSLMYTSGRDRETGSAWATALEAAEALGDTDYCLRALWGLWAGQMNNANYAEALDLARRFGALAGTLPGAPEQYIGDRMSGAALHFLGDQPAALGHIERMIANYRRPTHRSDAVRFQFDQLVTARITLSRALWLQGRADQALRVVEENIDEAVAINHTLSICNALAQSACPVALLAEDLLKAERYMRLLTELTTSEGLVIWRAYSTCFRGELLIRHGEAEGLQLLRTGLGQLRDARFVQHHTAFLMALASGLAGTDPTAAFGVIEDAIAEAARNSQEWCVAELLRIKGGIVLRGMATGSRAMADELFRRSLAIARSQGALSWELRTATSLARLRQDQGRGDEGHRLLGEVYGRFSEGFGTGDLVVARELLGLSASSHFAVGDFNEVAPGIGNEGDAAADRDDVEGGADNHHAAPA